MGDDPGEPRFGWKLRGTLLFLTFIITHLYDLAGVGGRELGDGETGDRGWGFGGCSRWETEFPGGNVSTERK